MPRQNCSSWAARVIMATVTSGRAMSAVLGGLGINGKLILLGVASDPLELGVIPLLAGRRSIQGWPAGTSIDSQDTLALRPDRRAADDGGLSLGACGRCLRAHDERQGAISRCSNH